MGITERMRACVVLDPCETKQGNIGFGVADNLGGASPDPEVSSGA